MKHENRKFEIPRKDLTRMQKPGWNRRENDFLDKNDALFVDGQKKIVDAALVALTIMIAESRPEEREIMISVVMNCMI